MKIRMGERLVKFQRGSCAEEEARIRERIRAARVAEEEQISTPRP